MPRSTRVGHRSEGTRAPTLREPLGDWSLQLELDGGAGLLRDFDGTATLPLVRDAWAEIRVEIDFDLDRQHVFYNGQHLVSNSWSEGAAPGGSLRLQAVDLRANLATTPVYYDDMALRIDFRSSCPADLDGDRVVGFADLLAVLSRWGPCPGCIEDLDADGFVGFGDLLQVLSLWGPCP